MILQRLVNVKLGATRLNNHVVCSCRSRCENQIIISISRVHIALNNALELGALPRDQVLTDRGVYMLAPRVSAIIVRERRHPIGRTLRRLRILGLIGDVLALIRSVWSIANVHALSN